MLIYQWLIGCLLIKLSLVSLQVLGPYDTATMYTLLPLYFLLVSAVCASSSSPLGKFFGRSGQNATYDYVVVGGGTAGLALASRLASRPEITIAVVEAGSFYEISNGNVSSVPGLDVNYDLYPASSQWASPSVDWGFLTTPQAICDNQTFHYARGKTLGGR